MTKPRKRPDYSATVSPIRAAKPPPRLEGDALYAWAQMVQKIQQLAEAKQMLANALLINLGYTPGDYLLSDDGYIVTPDQARHVQRPKSAPSEDSSSRKLDPDSPDSES